MTSQNALLCKFTKNELHVKFYHKVGQLSHIKKRDKWYYKVGQVLQSEFFLITRWGRYYKVGQLYSPSGVDNLKFSKFFFKVLLFINYLDDKL